MTTAAEWRAQGRLPEGLIYPDLAHSGMVETLVQNTDAFNAASQNTIRLITNRRMGDFSQESFFNNIDGLIRRRGTNTSPNNPNVTPKDLPANELVTVKVNRGIGPVDKTLDAFKKLGDDASLEELSFTLGQMIAKAVQVDQLEAGLNSVANALMNQSDLSINVDTAGSPAGSNLDTDLLVRTLAKMGDAASRVRMWVMHSKPFFDLVRSQITDNIDGVSNFAVANASAVTLNRPVLVTDSAALQVGASPTPTGYITLGLVENGVTLEDSEESSMIDDVITGKDNIVIRLQGEFAYNIGLKGLAWDVTNGGINPTDALLGTGSNWDSVMTSFKDLPGVAIRTR